MHPASASALFARCQPEELLRVLSPGLVTGVFDGMGWVDWEAEVPPSIQLVSLSALNIRCPSDPDRFRLVIDQPDSARQPVPFGAALSHTLARSRGLALISSRPGFLLHWCQRLAVPAQIAREHSSGPYRLRVSGPRSIPFTGGLRLVDANDVAREAILSVKIKKVDAAASLLVRSFPDLQVDQDSLNVPLAGTCPEEILGLLRVEGVPLLASAVWYPLLQSAPAWPVS